MIVELRRSVIRVRNTLRRNTGPLTRLFRVRVLFPDIGFSPVVYDLALERFARTDPVRASPSPRQVVEHLEGLTKP
jgi:hypothetical protein